MNGTAKARRQQAILELVRARTVASQDELARGLNRRGHAVAQSTLSRDLKELRISYGVEARFVMPVLNVPFRLIYAFKPNRSLRESLYVPERTFKFAVGTTF